jgi:hypothetical protein
MPYDLAVHGVYAEKAGTMQSKMHPCAAQLRASAECGQALLPFLGSTVTKRLRFCVPVPYDLAVHGVYAEKAGTMQSKMHPCAAQLRASAECGQALLPFLGSTVTKRLRFCAPVPHDLVVHGVYAVQAARLQVRVSARYGQR